MIATFADGCVIEFSVCTLDGHALIVRGTVEGLLRLRGCVVGRDAPLRGIEVGPSVPPLRKPKPTRKPKPRRRRR